MTTQVYTTNKSDGDVNPSTHLFSETPYGAQFSAYDPYYYRSTVGQGFIGYHKALRDGELLPINSYTAFVSRTAYSGFRAYSTWDAYGVLGVKQDDYYQPEPNINHWATPYEVINTHYLEKDRLAALVDPNEANIATLRACVKLTTSTHDTLTFAAELGKVVQMFRGLLRRVIGLLLSAKPSDWAKLWLEGRYGWRTLVYDMENISEAVERLGESANDLWKSKANNPDVVTTEEYIIPWAHYGGVYTTTLKYTHRVSYRGFAIGRMTPPPFGGSVLVTAWELVPWSFVIDWFIDIGSRLQYLSGLLVEGERVSGYGTLVHTSATSSITLTSPGGPAQRVYDQPSGLWIQMDGGQVDAKMEAMLRLRRPHIPSLAPSVNVRLDSFKVIDLIALLLNVIAKR